MEPLFDFAAERALVSAYWECVDAKKRDADAAAAHAWATAVREMHGARIQREFTDAASTVVAPSDVASGSVASTPRIVVRVCELVIPGGGLLDTHADDLAFVDEGSPASFFITPRSIGDLAHADTGLTRHNGRSIGVLIKNASALEKLSAMVGRSFVATLSPPTTAPAPVFGRRLPSRGIELIYNREHVWLQLEFNVKPRSWLVPRTPALLLAQKPAWRSHNPDRTPSFMLLNMAAVAPADEESGGDDGASDGSLSGESGYGGRGCRKRARGAFPCTSLQSCEASIIDVVASDDEA
jgi:hypothetical protein